MRPLPSRKELRQLLSYNRKTGILTWKIRPELEGSWNTRYAGTQAFTSVTSKGYLYGSLGDLTVKAHRVIWKWLYDTEPDQIDHINGDPSDNRQSNLRDVSGAENQKNMKIRSTNTSGHMGVRFRESIDKWHAYITVKGKQINLGCFDVFDEAVTARKTAEVKYKFHPNHGRSQKVIGSC